MSAARGRRVAGRSPPLRPSWASETQSCTPERPEAQSERRNWLGLVCVVYMLLSKRSLAMPGKALGPEEVAGSNSSE